MAVEPLASLAAEGGAQAPGGSAAPAAAPAAAQSTARPANPPLRTATVVSNFVLFQAAWFACILGAAHGWPWSGTAVVALVVAWHVLRAPQPLAELKLAMAATGIGFLWENLLMHTGIVQFISGKFIDALAPGWILAMWALFAITLNVSLRWLKGRWLLAFVMGAIAGPASYAAGVRMGAAVLPQPVVSLAVLSVGWALLTPLLLLLSQRWNGMQPPEGAHA